MHPLRTHEHAGNVALHIRVQSALSKGLCHGRCRFWAAPQVRLVNLVPLQQPLRNAKKSIIMRGAAAADRQTDLLICNMREIDHCKIDQH